MLTTLSKFVISVCLSIGVYPAHTNQDSDQTLFQDFFVDNGDPGNEVGLRWSSLLLKSREGNTSNTNSSHKLKKGTSLSDRTSRRH